MNLEPILKIRKNQNKSLDNLKKIKKAKGDHKILYIVKYKNRRKQKQIKAEYEL